MNITKSVECFEITITDTTNSGILTKNQVTSNCVPFVTVREVSGVSGYFYRFLVDAYFDGSSIVIKRYNSGGSIVASVYVVEFNPSEVKVQQGSFTMAGTNVSPTISGVNLNKAALSFNYTCSSSSVGWRYFTVRGRFSSSTALEFYRNASSGYIYGHYYVFEAIDDQFSVCTKLFSTSSTIAYSIISSSVCLHRSFALCSYYTSDDTSFPRYCAVRSYLNTSLEVASDRQYSRSSIYVSAFVIELKQGYVQQQFTSLTSSTTQKIYDIDTVDVNSSMVINPMCCSVNRADGDNSGYTPCAFHTLKLTTSGSKVQIDRTAPGSYSSYGSFQVVDWINNYVSSSGTAPQLNNSIIVSIEHVELEIKDSFSVSYLTKGQNILNCVPFVTLREISGTGGYFDRLYVNAYFKSDPSSVYVEKHNIAGTIMVSVCVVEFDPLKVRVQQGYFIMTGTSVSPIISGVNLNKAALSFNYVCSSSSVVWRYFTVRGRFLSDTTLIFERDVAGGYIHGYYYVFEAIDDQFSVQHIDFAFSGSYISSVIPNNVQLNKSFALCSYYTSDDTSFPRYCAVRSYLSTSLEVISDRQYQRSVIYVSAFVIELKQGYVQRQVTSFTSSTTQKIYDIDTVDVNSSMVINPMCCSVNRADGDNSGYTPCAFHTLKLTASGSKVQIDRTAPGGRSSYGSFQVVNWASENICNVSKLYSIGNSIIKSIEYVELIINDYAAYACLTKGQNRFNCVPFVTIKEISGISGYFARLLVDVYFYDGVVYANRSIRGGSVAVSIYVVEFNPSEVKVQQGIFTMAGTNVSPTISGVNLNKAALSFNYTGSSSSVAWRYFTVRGRFSSNTALEFYRDASSGHIYGHYYVFEATDAQFSVQHVDFSTGSTSCSISISRVHTERTFILSSYYTNDDTSFPEYCAVRLYLNRYSSIVCDKRYQRGVIYVSAFVIELKQGYVQQQFTSLTSSTTQKIYDIFNVDVNNSIVINPMCCSVNKAEGDGSGYTPCAFHTLKLTASGSKVQIDRTAPGGRSSYGVFQVIEFKPYICRYYFSGYVHDKEIPVIRTVAVYRRNSLELINSTISSGTNGYYIVGTPYNEEHYIVCLDDDIGTDYNDLIIGKATPLQLDW